MTEANSFNEQTQTSPPARSRRLLWGGVIVLVVLAAASLTLRTYLGRLRPGEVVDQSGTYVSPRGNYRVTITEQPAAGLVKIEVQSKTNSLWIFSSYGPNRSRYLDIERDWMVCFDEFDRMWLYIGKWPGPGRQRTLPGGGKVPGARFVLMQGFYFQRGHLSWGKIVVDQTNTWEGVPPEFFNRLPPASDPGWSPGAMVPAHPVPFSKTQRGQFR